MKPDLKFVDCKFLIGISKNGEKSICQILVFFFVCVCGISKQHFLCEKFMEKKGKFADFYHSGVRDVLISPKLFQNRIERTQIWVNTHFCQKYHNIIKPDESTFYLFLFFDHNFETLAIGVFNQI